MGRLWAEPKRPEYVCACMGVGGNGEATLLLPLRFPLSRMPGQGGYWVGNKATDGEEAGSFGGLNTLSLFTGGWSLFMLNQV